MFNNLRVNTAEIHHLANLLGGANIPYEMKEWLGGYQIAYPSFEEFTCSVIQNYGSYGGRDGYLEIMGLLTDEEEECDSVKGWLTAVEVFNRINVHYNRTHPVHLADCTIIGAGGEEWQGSAPSWE